jgi:hypothetical protein
MGIPCSHKLKYLINASQLLKVDDFHSQWYLNNAYQSRSVEKSSNSSLHNLESVFTITTIAIPIVSTPPILVSAPPTVTIE